jgi:hypothetical protein
MIQIMERTGLLLGMIAVKWMRNTLKVAVKKPSAIKWFTKALIANCFKI